MSRNNIDYDFDDYSKNDLDEPELEFDEFGNEILPDCIDENELIEENFQNDQIYKYSLIMDNIRDYVYNNHSDLFHKLRLNNLMEFLS